MLIYYILTIETVWVAIIAAVSALNLDSPRDIGLNLRSIAWFTSLLVKSPSGPINITELDFGFKAFSSKSLFVSLHV